MACTWHNPRTAPHRDAAGFDHVPATRLHRDAACEAALVESRASDVEWVPVPDTHSAAELGAKTETELLALEDRSREGRLKDAGKIGRAARRIVGEGVKFFV